MKKIFGILLLFVLFSTPIIGQEADTVPETKTELTLQEELQTLKDDVTTSEAERIIDKYGGRAIERFDEAVKQVTPLAEDAFKMVVRLQIAKGLVNLSPIVGFIIFFILFRIEYFRIDSLLKSDIVPDNMRSNYDVTHEYNISLLLIIYMVIAVVLFLISLFSFSTGFTHLIAPEWYAIKEIFDLF